ncbi:MAG TPA: peptide deformylase [Candidatus Paceibacterota bacterium]
MTIDILQKGAPALRKKATEVPLSEMKGAKVKKVLKDMQAALLTQDDGVALAAPQIGTTLRIFIVSKAVLLLPKELKERREANAKGLKRTAGFLTFINPVITKLSRDKAILDEGCLSVRPLYGKIKRSKKATIAAYDGSGKLFERGASGLLAQIFQHECDHLDGVLFIDKATDVRTMPTTSE